MDKKYTFHVLHLTRSIGPTSMPWNDLYYYQMQTVPEIMLAPLAVTSILGRLKENESPCRGTIRNHYQAGLFSSLRHIGKLYRKLNKNNQKLILHIHNPVLAVIAIIARIIFPGIVIIGNLHTDWRFLRPHQRFLLGKLAIRSNRFITVSKAIVQTIPKEVLKKLEQSNRLVSIPNGIDSEVLGSKDSSKLNKREPGTAIVVARIVPAKNASYVLDILESTPSIKKLIWLGGGPLMESFQNEIQQRKLEGRIELRGQCTRQDVFNVLKSVEIYISASLWEGIGVANMEAAALGAYPFLSGIPAHKEIADNLGFEIYPLEDVKEWSLGIEAFLKLPDNEKEKRRVSLKEKTLITYDIRKRVDQYIEVYKDAVNGK